MTDIPMKLILDLSKPEGDPDREQLIPLTPEEIAEREAMAAIEAEREAERQAAEQTLATLKASAKAKLIAGEPLTAEEADTLVP